MLRSSPLPEFLKVGLIAAGFGGALLAYRAYYPDNYTFLTSDETTLGFLISVVAMWMAVKLLETAQPPVSWSREMDEFCIGTGINLIADALLNYFQVLTRSLFLIVVGSLFAVLLLGIARRLMPRRHDGFQPGILMVGFDPLAHRLASALGLPVLGVVGAAPGCPAGIPVLGGWNEFDAVIAKLRPTQIVVAGNAVPGKSVSASKLLAQRLRGVPISETSGLYEKLLGRIYCRGWEPADMVLSQALSTNSRTLAIQAIYTNLIGMFLLILLSPLLLALALAVALFGGPGPVIQTAECSGFQNIPFPLMRFRTRKLDGAPMLVGTWMERLGLDRLPQLFHIVRGEMALFGPRPVRRQFARRLTEFVPFYGMRFSVKPGVLGWAQLQLHAEPARTCELTEIEYDLYYIKQGSPLLDFDILAGTLFGGRRAKVSAAELTQAVR